MANIKNINLNLVLVFDALMQERNITRAGEKIGLSQPGMSYSLGKLRRLCGDVLFVRSRTGMEPTEVAKALYIPLKRGLDQISEGFASQANFDPLINNTTYRLGLSDYTAAIVLPMLVPYIQKYSPNCSLNVKHVQRPLSGGQLVNDQLDLAISTYDKVPDTSPCEILFEEEINMLYDPKHTIVKSYMSMDTFKSHPHVLINFRENQPLTITKLLQEKGLTREVCLEMENVMLAGPIVQGSALICAIPKKIGDILCKQYGLKMCKAPINLPKYQVCMVWHQRTDQAKAHEWLRKTITGFDLKAQL